jgi:hypothetical protein
MRQKQNREIQAMLGIIRRATAPLFVTLLGGAALALFAYAASDSAALTATQTQELTATVASQVSWGTAGGCTQNMVTNNFENLVPNPTSTVLGSFGATPAASASTVGGSTKVWVGCVTTNGPLTSVSALGTKDMSNGTNTLALSNVSIGLTNATSKEVHGGVAGCEIAANQGTAGTCTLGSAQDLVTNASAGTTELNWQYQLNLPANQPVGSYTGGVVTFTATA